MQKCRDTINNKTKLVVRMKMDRITKKVRSEYNQKKAKIKGVVGGTEEIRRMAKKRKERMLWIQKESESASNILKGGIR